MKYISRQCLEAVSRRRFRTKDGVDNYQLVLDESVLGLSQSQCSMIMTSLEDTVIPVTMTWSHPDSSTCPSSIAQYLSQSGFTVSEEQNQVNQLIILELVNLSQHRRLFQGL